MRLLQNIIILVAVLIAATNINFAKSYTLVPNDTIVISGVLEDLQTLSIQQLNTSKDTVNLKWKKIKEVLPDNWEASVCDNSFCYTSLIESGTMIPVYPDDFGIVLLHITPKINYGESLIQYTVWDDKYPNEIDTLTYILQVIPASLEELELQNINIFPNPTSELINVSINSHHIYSYSLTDINSKQVLSGHLIGNITNFSIKEIPCGLYILEIKDRNGKVQITNPIIKN